ncbi:MAG: hypothetical protein E7318_00075 [Clostridiales bacterium]|nr:hypothetical protein [Clostridiales bacterium]
MKRIVSLLLGLLMVFMISPAMAETVVVKPGDTLEMQISLSGASDKGAEIGIELNEAPVEFVSAVGGDVNDTVPPKKFTGYFVVVNIKDVTIKPDGSGMTGSLDDYTLSNLVDGVIGTLTFMVAEDAEDGVYTVEAYKKSGSCTVNGSVTFEVKSAASDRIPGDVNDDGEVDPMDALLLDQYLADWGNSINLANADVNADGEVDPMDTLLIDRYLADWDVELI